MSTENQETTKTVQDYRMQLYCDIYKVSVMAKAKEYADRPHEFARIALEKFDELFLGIAPPERPQARPSSNSIDEEKAKEADKVPDEKVEEQRQKLIAMLDQKEAEEAEEDDFQDD